MHRLTGRIPLLAVATWGLVLAGCHVPDQAAAPATPAVQAPQPQPKPAPKPPAKAKPPAPAPPAKPAPAPQKEPTWLAPDPEDGREIVWDSFESRNRWTVESADDPAKLAINKEPKGVSAGLQSLRCEFVSYRKNRTHLRREVFLDLSQMSKMLFDVYSEADGLAVSVAFRLTSWQKFYQSYPVPLKKGWNEDVTVDLLGREFNMAERGAPNLSGLEGREDTRRISLVLHHKPDTKGVVFMDNIRFRGWPDKSWDRRGPEILSLDASASTVRQFEKFELRVDFEGAYGDFFDPSELDITAHFINPEGDHVRAHGYLHEFTDGKAAAPLTQWLVRLSPDVLGRWEYCLNIRTREGETRSDSRVFYCREPESSPPRPMPTSGLGATPAPEPPPSAAGFIRRSKIDGHYFEFDGGEFFYPLGQNVCWATDYEPYFQKMAASGENFARIWMCPWHLPLELPSQVGHYSLESAKGLDRVIALAEQYGIYLQIVIEYHGMLRDDSWGENPYNQANGGPCKWPQDFFVDAEAKRLFKQRLRYIASRWAYCPHVFAWELFNEADLTKHYDPSHVVRWHAEMGRYLKSVDPHRHMVTTSSYSDHFAEELWKQWPLDFAQAHRYTPDVVRFVTDTAMANEDLHKPFFIGEFGRGWTADVDQRDADGAHLHAGIWAAFMTPSAGNAMVWWWDTYVDAQNHYRHYLPLAAFAKGEDRRRMNYEPVRLVADAPNGKQVDVRGLLCSTRCLLWLFHRDDAKTPSPVGVPRIPAGAALRLAGMWPGDYVVEFWDTYRVAPPRRQGVECVDGMIEIVFPEAERDLACKVIFQGSTTPEIRGVEPPK